MKNLEIQENDFVLEYLRTTKGSFSLSLSPSEIHDPYYRLGCHPDLVARLWDELGNSLPKDCRWVVYGNPALVHPTTNTIFAFCRGTHMYALRIPENLLDVALSLGAKSTFDYPSGSIAASSFGNGWLFGNWIPEEANWLAATYNALSLNLI